MNKKIVVLGGGTGLSAMLRGIKYINDIDITAIVTVADSGGSAGIISSNFNIPAVGDLRRVIASLSRDRQNLEKSMEYRIEGTNTDLDGHAIGNLILTSQIKMEGDFAKGIESATKMLNIQGRVLPVSNEFNNLNAELVTGEIIIGEDNIGHSKNEIKKVFYEKGEATSEAVQALLDADYIFLGIGSLYTSLIANLIYPTIKEALKETKAKVVYFANVFTQHGETDDMSLSDHIKAIELHTHKNMIDEVIISNTKISKKAIDSYEVTKQFLVKNDIAEYREFDLLEEINENTIRHNETKVKNAVEKIIS